MSETLAAMEPSKHADSEIDPEVVETLATPGLTFKVWGGDWCPDCTEQLPQFAAVLAAAGVPDDRIEQFPVEKVDGEKRGPEMEEYGVTHIPTVIVFADGEEVARFVESADPDIATALARQLDEH